MFDGLKYALHKVKLYNDKRSLKFDKKALAEAVQELREFLNLNYPKLNFTLNKNNFEYLHSYVIYFHRMNELSS